MPFATHILVPTDFSKAAALAVEAAAELARESKAKLTVAHVFDPEALEPPATLGWSREKQKGLSEEIQRAVENELEKLKADKLESVEDVDLVILRDRSAARAICDHAERIGADLIVISTHGRTGLGHLLIGSVAERVVRTAQVPVLTLRSKVTNDV